MDIALIAGLWLPRSIWTPVVDELQQLGHRPLPIALPGVEDGDSRATLDDQLTATLAVVDAAERPMVVGHSAACTLAWLVADRRYDSISKVVLVGGFPAGAGETYADFFPIVDGVVPFPGWEPFEGPDSGDLSEAARTEIAAQAVPVPGGVAQGIVHFAEPRRRHVPTLMVCPEYTPEQARAWIDAGDVPELSEVENLAFADIDSGHWPMVSKPAEFARLLHEAAIT